MVCSLYLQCAGVFLKQTVNGQEVEEHVVLYPIILIQQEAGGMDEDMIISITWLVVCSNSVLVHT